MLNCFLQLIKDFQPFVVGALGFSGVMYTLRRNSRLSLEQHERNVKHEREVLRTALRAELELTQNTFSRNSSIQDESLAVNSAYYPIETYTKVYDQYIGKLGLLTTEEISAVIKAYTIILETPMPLSFLSDHQSSYDKRGYIFIEAKNRNTAAAMYKSFLPSIEIALEKLAGN